MDSLSHATAGDRGAVLVTGSHGGHSAGELAREIKPLLVTFNDAGFGKGDAGVSGLAMLDQVSIAACAVGNNSARIGEALDHWANGIISAANRTAVELGIVPGMTVRMAVDRAWHRPAHSRSSS